MKFGQDYQVALLQGEYPKEWVNSAISYKKLKKCIKRVRQELLSLGLDKDILDHLWQNVGSDSAEVLRYSMGGEDVGFTPRLTIAIDPVDGSPMDAWLAPETKRILRRLARSSKGDIVVVEDETDQDYDDELSPDGASRKPSNASDADERQQLETVEVPLTSDSEFFQILQREIADLDLLQESEQARMRRQITELGQRLSTLKKSNSKKAKQEIDAWRRIFEQYMEAEVFLSSHEVDAGARNASDAQQQYQFFKKSLKARRAIVHKLGKDANGALGQFFHINLDLLRLLSFQEINKTALAKIMKKFDKQTSLRAQSTVSNALVKTPFMAHDLARAAAVTISEEILSIIPQANDYLCPICFSITWKPVRLHCNHVFCIRCLIVMQQQQKNHCPLCREAVVLAATSDEIDRELMTFLKANFKQEVKEKQKQNDIAAGIDRWGETYDEARHCIIM